MDNYENTISEDNILVPMAVGELLKQQEGSPVYHFYIPSYQRGYRWDDDQVFDLLNDLNEFIEQADSNKYCLQPIVVKRMPNRTYEVLDGQQRLTTIYILLKCLKTYLPRINTYLISYQTRPKSAQFLEKLTSLDYTEAQINDENPDYYFISRAYAKIGKWLDEQSNENPEISSTLYAALVKRTEFIWYQIFEETDAIEVFTRINIGKILLTNAELVKAVFLSKNNLSIGSRQFNDQWLNVVQSKISTEWDLMQAKLLNEKFWGFIFSGSKNYETRIDYIIELKYDLIKEDKNQYASFRAFYEDIQRFKKDENHINQLSYKNTSLIEDEWYKVKFIVDVLEEWYEHHYYYHHIGFLISQGTSILDLIDEYLQLDKKQFQMQIEKKISNYFIGCKLKKLSYEGNRKLTEKVLLLYNVLSTYEIQDSSVKFPFEIFKANHWSLEHIYAQNSEKLKADQYAIWLTDNVKSLKNLDDAMLKDLVEEMELAIAQIDDLKKDSVRFTDIFTKVGSYYLDKVNEIDRRDIETSDNQEEKEDDSYLYDADSIVNLALLDSASNSALNNSLFDVKRMLILERDKRGINIPIETKRIFLKYHTPMPRHLFYWTLEDKRSYEQNLSNLLMKFIS